MGAWEIGDWLIEGLDDKELSSKAYEVAEQITGWQRETLYNVVWVVRRFPMSSSLRSETTLKWSHFKELARVADERVREELLQQFSNGFEHSVIDVRARVDATIKKLSGPRDSGKAKKPNGFVSLTVSLAPDSRDQIKALARARAKTPDALLRGIVEEYLANDQKKIESEIRRTRKSQRRSKRVVAP
jgi:hypothetical protein